VTLNRPNTVKSRTKESGRKCGERLRVAGRLEQPPRLRSVVRTQQIEFREHSQQVLGVSSALDTSVTWSPIASWISPDSIG
jgi:hypothetical protein